LLKPVAILVLALATVAAVGCGGSTHNTYKDDFPPISRKIVSLGQQVGKAVQNAGRSTDRQLADDFGSYAQDLGDLRKQLDGLHPPKDLADDQKRLVRAIGGVQGSLDDISRAARRKDPGAAKSATAELIQRSQGLGDARSKLADAVRKL
jgi:hypothetical protein